MFSESSRTGIDNMNVVVYEIGGGGSFTIEVPPLARIDDVKMLIQEKSNLDPGLQQVLLGESALLDGEATATECGIKEGTTLTLVLQMPDERVNVTLFDDCIVEHRQVVTKTVIKQVPRFTFEYVDKHVPPGPVDIVEKVVEVQQTVYEDVIVEVPELQHVIVHTYEAKPVFKFVDRPIVDQELVTIRKFKDIPVIVIVEDIQYVETIVEVPVVLTIERAIHNSLEDACCCTFPFPQAKAKRVVEIVKQVPRIQVEPNPKVVKVKVIQYVEKTTEYDVPIYRQGHEVAI